MAIQQKNWLAAEKPQEGCLFDCIFKLQGRNKSFAVDTDLDKAEPSMRYIPLSAPLPALHLKMGSMALGNTDATHRYSRLMARTEWQKKRDSEAVHLNSIRNSIST